MLSVILKGEISMLIYLIPFALILAADLITKQLVAMNLEVGQSIPGINGLFEITYVQNQGAAFGILQGRKMVLVFVTLVIFALLIIYALRRDTDSKWLMWGLTLVCSGGMGNLIDRVAFGYVRDFIDLSFVKFPVFNIADCGVTVGAIMMVLYIMVEEHRRGEEDFFDGDPE